MSKKQTSLLVTDFAQFYRAVNGEETRFYPTSSDTAKAHAVAFDAKSDATIVGGFAVYDTTITVAYGIALYASAEEADKHKASDAPKAPEHAVDPDPVPTDIAPMDAAQPVSPPHPTPTVQDQLDDEPDDGKPAKKRRK
jgi:hypothetical protein